jgi:ActR/RegA family two-component response regulator
MKRKKILIIDNLEKETVELRKSLITSGFEVRIVQKSNEVEAYFNEFLPDMLIVEMILADTSLASLVKFIHAKENNKIVPVVATGNPRTVEERVSVLEREVDDFIYKPFELDEVIVRLENLLKEASEVKVATPGSSTGFSGSLSEMTLVDLLQTLEVGKKTSVIMLYKDGHEGKVFMSQGEVVDARLNDLEPKQALLRMFTWMEGQFSVEMKNHETAKRLYSTTREMISEGMTRQFRWEQLTKQLPPLKTIAGMSPEQTQDRLTNDEQQICKLIDGRKSIIEIVEKCSFDDVKALRLFKSLYDKGFVVKTTEPERLKQGESRSDIIQETHNGSTANMLVANVLSGMFRAGQVNASGNDTRRRIDRRRVGRRSSDRQGGASESENKIWLNKTELIMIREKLLAGIKRKTYT